MADEARCDNCGYSAAKLNESTGSPGGERGDFKFCDVCWNTYLSRATLHPRQYGDQAPLFASLGYIANMILGEIRQPLYELEQEVIESAIAQRALEITPVRTSQVDGGKYSIAVIRTRAAVDALIKARESSN
jgi:hypothetical protein